MKPERPESKSTAQLGTRVPVHDHYSRISPVPPAQAQSLQHQSNSSSTPLRRGKWTPEEEAYALAAIRDFNSGYLDAPPGSTLRSYLSEKLQCDPMRITKKFTGDASIGKKVFHPAVRNDPKTLEEIEDSKANLGRLYRLWKQRLEAQEQALARKSAAAAAVSIASSLHENPHFPLFSDPSPSTHLLQGVRCTRMSPEMMNAANENKVNILSDKAKNDITKTATWLERADSLLSNTKQTNPMQKEIETEMKEIARLIEEGEAVLAVSKNLPKIFDNNTSGQSSNKISQSSIHKLHSCPDLRMGHSEQSISTSTAGKRKRSLSDDENISDSPIDPMKLLASLSSQAAPVPVNAACRVTDSSTGNSSERIPEIKSEDAEDAKTFVNFLQSVVKK